MRLIFSVPSIVKATNASALSWERCCRTRSPQKFEVTSTTSQTFRVGEHDCPWAQVDWPARVFVEYSWTQHQVGVAV